MLRLIHDARYTSHFRYIVSTESGNVLIWNRITEQVLFKEEQQFVRQLTLVENSTKFLAVSRPKNPAGVESMKTTATLFMRTIPGILRICATFTVPIDTNNNESSLTDGKTIFSLEYVVRSQTSNAFRNVVMTSDHSFLIAPAADKGSRDCVIIYNGKSGVLVSKIPIKLPGFKVRL